VYALSDPSYSGNWTVPVLFDKVKNTIVNNESSEIIRMLNSEFNEFCATNEQKGVDLYPEELRSDIDRINEWVYR
jgi:putative glutathione S-transferase